MPYLYVQGDQRTAEATAQDSACAFILVVDNTIQRLRQAILPDDTRNFGADYRPNVKLNAVIRALSNQARHIHVWGLQGDLENHEDAKVIRSVDHDPLSPNVSREIICGLPVSSYVALEEMLLTTAHDVLQTTKHRLGMLAAGTARLDPAGGA